MLSSSGFLDGQKWWNRRRECLGEGSPLGLGGEVSHGQAGGFWSGGLPRGLLQEGILTTLAFHEVTTCSYRVGRAFSETVRDRRKTEDFDPRHRA